MKQKIWGWSAIFFTMVLLVFLKWLHLGVTHYNWFLIILLSWTMGVIMVFRYVGPDPPKEDQT